jgi:AbrB family looped-hinge helix DNA binding protein
MRKIVRVLRAGQVTIPKEIRKELGMEAGGMVAFELKDGKLSVEPVGLIQAGQGSPWLEELYAIFEPVREALKDVPEEEINKWIDEAVAEVRARNK